MPRAFLNVEKSLTGRRWIGPLPEADRLAEAMVQVTRLPFALAQLLVARGVAPEKATQFLAPQLRDLLPDPLTLKDMDKAVDHFLSAVRLRKKIAIFADYDVDGGSSAALLVTWLRDMGRDATLYVPDRIDEGYGPNAMAMAKLGSEHDLILCVDCGTLSHEPIAAAGCAVIVLDHHLGQETLPPAVAVVNPNRQDETGHLAHLCAASVVFLFLVEANRQIKAMGQVGPDLMGMLDLVALATVADVAPLVGVNRAFVRQGLKVMARRDRPGLRALADVGRLDQAPTTYALGFVLGPRVNAGGRIGQADLGARLLATDDPAEAVRLAQRLDQLNTERREIEAEVRTQALAQVDARGALGAFVWAAGEGWHPGVVGIVAARLKEAYHRPAVVIGLEGREGKGSARSVAGIDLGSAIHRLADEGLLIKGGGHKMAAGLTVARDGLPAAMARLEELIAKQGIASTEFEDLRIDSLVEPTAVTVDFIEQIEMAGPFGASAQAPRFAFSNIRVASQPMGDNHLRLQISTEQGTLDGVAFGVRGSAMGQALADPGHRLFHLAGRIDVNRWGGRTRAQFRLEDAAEA